MLRKPEFLNDYALLRYVFLRKLLYWPEDSKGVNNPLPNSNIAQT